MKIGWLSHDNSFNELVNNLIFSNHEILYYIKNNSSFKTNKNLLRIDSVDELLNSDIEVIFTYFNNSTEAYSIFFKDIINKCKHLNKKVTLIDLSSISVNLVEKILLKTEYIDYLSAPIIRYSNSFNQLFYTMPISGKKFIFDKVSNLLADLEIDYFYCGGLASAQVLNSASAMLNSFVTLGVFEAINYAISNQLDLNTLYEAVSSGAGSSNLLSQFFKKIINKDFDDLNDNLINASHLVSNVLVDNKNNNYDFLLSKVIYGILKRQGNNTVNLDVNTLAKFYNLNLLNTNNSIDNNFTDFDNSNGFNSNYVVDNNYNLFNSFESYEKPITTSNEKLEISSLKKESINNDNNVEIEKKPIIDFNDEAFSQTQNQSIFDFIDNSNANDEPNNNEPSEYKTPESLTDTNLKPEIKNLFEDKVDEEKGSLGSKEGFVEYITPNKTENFAVKSDTEKHNTLVEDLIGKELKKEANKINLPVNEGLEDFFNFDLNNMDLDTFTNNGKKVLVFDLDGTLLNENKRVNVETISAMQKAYQEGHELVIATGRSYQQTIDVVNQVGVVRYAVMNNGALIYDKENNKIFRNTDPLPKDLIKYFFEIVFSKNIPFLLYSDLNVYMYNFTNDDKKVFLPYINERTIDISGMSIDELFKYLNNNNIDLFNLCAHCEALTEEDWVQMFKYYKEDLKLCNLTSALKGSIDIYGASISKYIGYLKLKEMINCFDDDVYFFGDSNNDYDLMSHLENGVAMGNANPRLKAISKYVIGDNNSTAIADFIESSILEKRF
ncbi:Cof-type HAD-IIB family hydrolase [Malacoplasma penetrans]|uniref:Cof-type HAD-IIB family hydrolase n=1 Tax=Malacoplasma penetrans TaxID=28227 RepID=UPI0010112352|nr:Cof-type HAD-IIB family hydrolase [Malacoplasma penetrans]RXY96609.1 Cof-type HAD-IIB family hydrolase [Malacoplasma penetrans]